MHEISGSEEGGNGVDETARNSATTVTTVKNAGRCALRLCVCATVTVHPGCEIDRERELKVRGKVAGKMRLA